MSTAKVIECVGKSEKSWEDAAENAVKDTSKSVRNIKCVDIVGQTGDVNEDGEITEYRTDVKILFVVED